MGSVVIGLGHTWNPIILTWCTSKTGTCAYKCKRWFSSGTATPTSNDPSEGGLNFPILVTGPIHRERERRGAWVVDVWCYGHEVLVCKLLVLECKLLRVERWRYGIATNGWHVRWALLHLFSAKPLSLAGSRPVPFVALVVSLPADVVTSLQIHSRKVRAQKSNACGQYPWLLSFTVWSIF